MSTLDAVLKSWSEAHGAACRQVDRHRILGFSASALPSSSALTYATLAALGARGKLEESIRPEVQALRAKGVLDPYMSLSQLNAGVLAAIEIIRPHLRRVLDLVDAMTARALGAEVARTHESAPVLRVPLALQAACGQTVRIEIGCAAADRILIHASGLGLTRVITQPPAELILSLTLFPGELLVYAENDAGYCKLVRPIVVGARSQRTAPDHRFVRAAADSGGPSRSDQADHRVGGRQGARA